MRLQTYQCRTCNIEVQVEQEHATGHKCEKCGQDMWFVAGLGIAKGDSQEFYSQELGALGIRQKEYRQKHPDAEFSKTGALKIKNPRHLDGVLKEKGMVCLTDSKEYRDKMKKEAAGSPLADKVL